MDDKQSLNKVELNSDSSQNKSTCSQQPHVCQWVDQATGTLCGRKFNQKGNLLQHMRMHRGEKLFACEICGQIFSTSSNRNDHQRRHNMDKPYKCSYPDCKLEFYRRYQLIQHQEKQGHQTSEDSTLEKKNLTSKINNVQDKPQPKILVKRQKKLSQTVDLQFSQKANDTLKKFCENLPSESCSENSTKRQKTESKFDLLPKKSQFYRNELQSLGSKSVSSAGNIKQQQQQVDNQLFDIDNISQISPYNIQIEPTYNWIQETFSDKRNKYDYVIISNGNFGGLECCSDKEICDRESIQDYFKYLPRNKDIYE